MHAQHVILYFHTSTHFCLTTVRTPAACNVNLHNKKRLQLTKILRTALKCSNHQNNVTAAKAFKFEAVANMTKPSLWLMASLLCVGLHICIIFKTSTVSDIVVGIVPHVLCLSLD